jgi:PST family polysaccharide transporter
MLFSCDPRDERCRSDLTILRRFAVLSGGQFLGKLTGFVAFAALARTLGADAYGTVEYLVAWSVVFAAVVECGLGIAGVRRHAARPDADADLAAQVSAVRLGLAVISVPLMVWLAAPALPDAAPHALVWLFALSLLAVPWRHDWLLQATERMGHVASAHVMRAAVFALIVLLLVRGPADILVVGWAEVVAAIAMSLYCLAVQRGPALRIVPSMRGTWGLLREGATVGLGQLVWTVTQYAPLFLVARLVGAQETAWLAAASRVVVSLLAFSNLYHFNLYPRLARTTAGDAEELAAIVTASFRVVAWAGTLVALTLTLLAEPLSTLIFGATFGAATPMLLIMAWTLPISLLSGHARWSLAAAGQQTRVVYAQLAGLIVVVVAGVPMVMLLRGRGAALAAVAASAAVWMAAHTFATRRVRALPSLAIALRPTAVALLVIGAVQLLPLDHHWSAGIGVLAFAAVACLDRRLVPAFTCLSMASTGTWAPPLRGGEARERDGQIPVRAPGADRG